GYRVKFLVDTFSSSQITNLIEWQGKAVFEELPGSEAQKKIWKQKREETYYGSSRNFFRALHTGKLAEDGFIMKKLTRELNPERPQEGVILQEIKKAKEINNRDSLNYWIFKEKLRRYYHENLSKLPLDPYQIMANADKPGLFMIGFTDCLYVIYTKRHEETDFPDLYRPLDMENFETSVLVLRGPYAVFDMNGVVEGGELIQEGTWSKAKLAELLPYDYAPGEGK
ncbi:MAG: hypothetical protein ABI203_03560, partial [Mucilaginibacter sp.]